MQVIIELSKDYSGKASERYGPYRDAEEAEQVLKSRGYFRVSEDRWGVQFYAHISATIKPLSPPSAWK